MFDPFAPGFASDPYPVYRREREGDPVQRLPVGPWIVFRHADVVALLRDSSTSVDVRRALQLDPDQQTVRQRLIAEVAPDRKTRDDHSILNIDPPDHTRLRRLVSSVFTPRRIAELRPMVQRIVDEHLDRVVGQESMDLIGDLAFPLPFTVISEMLGMPDGDRDRLRDLSHTLVRILDITITPDEMRAALIAGEEMRGHVAEMIEWKRSNPADDLLTGLIRAEEDGDVLSDVELLDQVTLLFIAGHETTVNLIGNGVWALLSHRDQLELLRDDPTVEATAIDELLRFDSPVQMSRRIAVEPIEIDGNRIEPGSFVLTSLGSANRDAEVFGPTSEDLDLRRHDAARHLSFGSGIHHCLGASLARLEGLVAITSLIRRFPELEASSDPEWNGRFVLRGMESLELRLS